VSALRFFYQVTLKKDWRFDDVIPAPKKPQTLPVVLSLVSQSSLWQMSVTCPGPVDPKARIELLDASYFHVVFTLDRLTFAAKCICILQVYRLQRISTIDVDQLA
jgi:hypothetical protein